jgi:glycosyltransferase involved in cell wall biosynthesis
MAGMTNTRLGRAGAAAPSASGGAASNSGTGDPGPSALPVLFLTHYDRIGAPSRYRFYQYFPRFMQARIAPRVDFIQSDAMCVRKQQGQELALFALQVLLAYLRRMALLLRHGRRYPVWVIEKELFPMLPFWIERLFIPRGARIIVDYDDAVFLKYDRPGPRGWLTRGKIARLMHRADTVFSGNDYITEYARRAGARDVRWVPSVVDESKYRASPLASRPPVIGWMGAYRNSHHIASIAGALRRLAQSEDFVLRIVGGARIALPPEVRVEYRPWSEEEEIGELEQFTVGIMPLVYGEWEKGKCGLKLIQYLAAGVPVVATPIGINREIVSPGVNGYLASTEDEWLEALRRVLAEKARGEFAPEQCAATVASRFTLAAVAPAVTCAIRSLARGADAP